MREERVRSRLIRLPLWPCALALMLACAVGRADEGGVPFWISGQYASLAATPPNPGWDLNVIPYYYTGTAGTQQSFERGIYLVSGLQTQAPLVFVQPGYAFSQSILGAEPYVGVAFGGGRDRTQADVTIANSATAIHGYRSDSIAGGSDLYPLASLSWTKSNNNWMAYLTGDIPTGAYDPHRLSNIGLGHAAIDAGGGYTYLSLKTGLEFTAVTGFTHNFENTDTNYRNGVDFHLDWALSQFLSERWEVGVVGYVYYQLSADTYPTTGPIGDLRAQLLGPFESRVASVGPEVGYAFKMGGHQAYANIRGYWEFWSEHRLSGKAVFATISLPLGK